MEVPRQHTPSVGFAILIKDHDKVNPVGSLWKIRLGARKGKDHCGSADPT